MKHVHRLLLPLLASGLLLLLAAIVYAVGGDQKSFLPVYVYSEAPTPTPVPPPTPPPGHMVEMRALWITRFDWMTSARPGTPETVDKIVDDAANAGFNVLLFQVRGEADAYYQSSVVPWAGRLTGALGQPPSPYWDPLTRLIARARERGLQVHAYINVYPVWLGTGTPPHTQPEHLYHLLANAHGQTWDPEDNAFKNNGLQWDTGRNVITGPGVYLRATPASIVLDNHLLEVIHELVTHYDLDGVHLDHARYAQSGFSCDPVSEAAFKAPCFSQAGYADWQRSQINGTVSKFYHALFADPAWTAGRSVPVNLSAAVWPLYQSGRNTYYQDSKAWILGGYIDTLMPMLYGSFDTSVSAWQGLAAGFQADNAGRFVVPGIAGTFSDFSQISGRIEAARALGTAGHAIFSYGGLADRGYFDDLANGPYATPAVPPVITWHP
jgi:uncharacterized lipoprotein YddW (UPF0748 family)